MKNRWRRLLVVIGFTLTMIAMMACGNSEINESVAEENASKDEMTSDMVEEQESIAESSVNDETDNLENGEAEADESSEGEEIETEEPGKYVLGDVELEKILAQYDNVLSIGSSDGITPLFGYTIPEGWERVGEEFFGADGRVEKKNQDELQHSAEEISLYWAYNQPITSGSETEKDYYDYDKQDKEAIYQFLENGVWEEPERAEQLPFPTFFYTTEMIKQGEIETPYGIAVLYSQISEICDYTEKDEEKQVYTAPQNVGWDLCEGMIIEIDDYFIQVVYRLDDWKAYRAIGTETELPEEFANHEYTGRLEEIIPQMFAVE